MNKSLAIQQQAIMDKKSDSKFSTCLTGVMGNMDFRGVCGVAHWFTGMSNYTDPRKLGQVQ